MTDRIDEAIASSLQRIMEAWRPIYGEPVDDVVDRLEQAIWVEIDWLRAP